MKSSCKEKGVPQKVAVQVIVNELAKVADDVRVCCRCL